MDKDLKEILRTVLEEELEPFKNEMTQKFVKIDERFDDMDSRLGQIEQAVHRIKENQTEETIGLLRNISKKLEEKDLQFQAINKKAI